MLDVLSLPAVIAKHPTVSFEGSSLPPASCQRLQRVLATIFEQCGPAVGVADLDGMPSSPSVSQPDGAIASVMLEKCSRVLLQLLVAADSKQISSIIADIFKQVYQREPLLLLYMSLMCIFSCHVVRALLCHSECSTSVGTHCLMPGCHRNAEWR